MIRMTAPSNAYCNARQTGENQGAESNTFRWGFGDDSATVSVPPLSHREECEAELAGAPTPASSGSEMQN